MPAIELERKRQEATANCLVNELNHRQEHADHRAVAAPDLRTAPSLGEAARARRAKIALSVRAYVLGIRNRRS